MIGLGRMGMNMVRRLLRGGHKVVAYNRTPDKTRETTPGKTQAKPEKSFWNEIDETFFNFGKYGKRK